MQGHVEPSDGVLFYGTYLESVGELREQGERSGKGYQDEGRDRVHCKSGLIGSALFLTIWPIGLASRRVVLTDIDMLCGVPGRHGPIEGLPWPSPRGPQI